MFLDKLKNFLNVLWDLKSSGGIQFFLLAAILIYLSYITLMLFYWSSEPDFFNVSETTKQYLKHDGEPVIGQYSTATLLTIADTLLDKPGGYLSNDITLPGVMMDNMPNWEFGALSAIRDYSRVLRNDMSRSLSQSREDQDLAIAEPKFHFDSESWIFPQSESEYNEAIQATRRYLHRLSDSGDKGARFYASAVNLVAWLHIVEKRLGDYSQRLSASIGQIRTNTDLAGDADAQQSTKQPAIMLVETPWLEIDDIFWETRGAAWALLHLFKAIEIDFEEILKKKNAVVIVKQVIRELEGTQEFLWSPYTLNGSGYGLVTNYSLIQSSYISRANAAIIDLKNLLTKG